MQPTEEITRDDLTTVRLRRECRLWLSATVRRDRPMTKKVMFLNKTPQCPACQEPYLEPHDVARCKVIARAWVLETAHLGDEVSYQIVTLVCWLRDHPEPAPTRARTNPRWYERIVSNRADKKAFLDHYIQVAQQ